MTWIIITGIAILSVVSGMLGLGVAFAAVPFLGLFLPDLVHQVQPLSLLLNGLTASASALGFARGGHVDWRIALPLCAVTAVSAPVGAYLAQFTPQPLLWVVYLVAVVVLAYRLFRPIAERPGAERVRVVFAFAAPISVLSGLLGVGPGFLLMPTLMLAGLEAKRAAGVNAVAVTLPSFTALAPHLHTARLDLGLTVALVAVGTLASFLGSRLTSRYVAGARLKQIFAILIVVATLYKVLTLLAR